MICLRATSRSRSITGAMWKWGEHDRVAAESVGFYPAGFLHRIELQGQVPDEHHGIAYDASFFLLSRPAHFGAWFSCIGPLWRPLFLVRCDRIGLRTVLPIDLDDVP